MTKTPRKTQRFSKKRYVAANQMRIGLLTPQAQVVLDHLLTSKTITQREAIMDHSVQSLTRRITELRDSGFDVGGDWKVHPAHWPTLHALHVQSDACLMFSNPDPDDNFDDDDGFSFGPYDIKTLIGTTLIAWAFATSVGLAIYLS